MSHPSFNLNLLIDKEKLKTDGSNFVSWFRDLKSILETHKVAYILEAPLGDLPNTASDIERIVHEVKVEISSYVQSGMLFAMEADLQNRFMNKGAYEIITELMVVFARQVKAETYEATVLFFSAQMEEHGNISEHLAKLFGCARLLSDLGSVIPEEVVIDRALISLPPSYKNAIVDYGMKGTSKPLSEILKMLEVAELEIKLKKMEVTIGSPERNCPKYLEDRKSGKTVDKEQGIFDIHVIDVYLTSARSNTWVFDTGSVAHICNSQEELRNRRRLAKDEVTMRVGNGSRVDVVAVGTLPLHLPSGLVLVLNKCYFVPSLSVNIISGSCLLQDGYSFKSVSSNCAIYMNDIFMLMLPRITVYSC